MSLRSRVAKDWQDFKDGLTAANEEVDERAYKDAQVFGPRVDLAMGAVMNAARTALFGFLLARPGVPFLPHDNDTALAMTIAAGVMAALPLRIDQPKPRLLVLGPTLVLVLITLRLDRPSTSIVLIGAAVAGLARAADSYPFLYGLVAGMALLAVGTHVWDWTIFKADQTFLSGKPWTPDRGAHEALLLAGFLFLSSMLSLVRHDADRFRAKAIEAQEARHAAVADERARIARELHDVVSHHVTAMTLQAEAAAMTGDKQTFSAVAGAGREALTELRRMLGVLRRPDTEAPDALDPQPGLEQLDALAQRTASGPTVTVRRVGDVRPLTAGLELGVYRLVQEALTNSAKHSDATTVDVVLTFGASELTVDVLDNGRPLVAARVGSSGLGLVGMQERIALLNGELETGPRTDAPGFRVHATLPIDA